MLSEPLALAFRKLKKLCYNAVYNKTLQRVGLQEILKVKRSKKNLYLAFHSVKIGSACVIAVRYCLILFCNLCC